MVGEAIFNAEAVLEDVVYGADDEIHHRWWGVVYAAGLARGLVVRLEVVFVKVDEGVALEQPVLFFICRAHFAVDRFASRGTTGPQESTPCPAR